MNDASRTRLEEARVLLHQVKRIVTDVRLGLDAKFEHLPQLAQHSPLAEQNTVAYNALQDALAAIESLDQQLVHIKGIRGR